MGQADLSAANWVKSRFSSGGDNCVEVAFGASETVGLRDSKVVRGPLLAVSGEAFSAFLDGVKRGQLDRTARSSTSCVYVVR
ncbi:DUF397 domain-containing protein [Streptomyces spongiae]|uniref:DUF397 domain-containing protein n=1 Tax=Streptomyces spongiae TaxID=565072 RepID=A0A5N8XV58_9ACTN|nr:DUF397 domain-containing protein [Streptomyces spongiae]